jgi:hypothetical protein
MKDLVEKPFEENHPLLDMLLLKRPDGGLGGYWRHRHAHITSHKIGPQPLKLIIPSLDLPPITRLNKIRNKTKLKQRRGLFLGK